MKIRTDFVTNSSSSSFSVMIEVIDKNDKKYTYSHYPIDNDNEDIGPVGLEYRIEDKIKKSKNLDELCELLKQATETYSDCEQMTTAEELLKEYKDEKEEFTEYPGYDAWQEHLDKIKEEKEKFVKDIKKSNFTLEDIKTINIIQNWYNTGEYMETWNEDGYEEIEKITQIDMKTKKINTTRKISSDDYDNYDDEDEYDYYFEEYKNPIELIVPPEKEFTNTAEKIMPGEKIELVRIYDNEDYKNSIMIVCDKGKLGYLYISIADDLAPLIDKKKMKISGYIDSVIPLSQRPPRCRKPIVNIKITLTKN